MAKEFWIFCLFSYFVRADTDYELYNNDGWIPITNIQAYNTRRSDVIPEQHTTKENTDFNHVDEFIQVVTPNIRTSKDFSPRKGNPTEYEKTSKELFQDIKPVNFSVGDYHQYRGKGNYRYYFKIANDLYKPSHLYIVKFSGSSIYPDRKNSTPKINNSPLIDTNRFDRSLKIPKENSGVNKAPLADEVLKTFDYINGNKKNINSEAHKILEKKNYEVTEEAESLDTNHGYVYQTPMLNTSNKLNLTNKLFNDLAKYNIRADDDLQNYVISRTPKDQNPTARELLRPFDLKARGYNSLNHLPVDPLLAVFLSHYGHYLPSAYGIRNNYNNAYGYLASNNIHNNKPFGMYKMFSDNDSRN